MVRHTWYTGSTATILALSLLAGCLGSTTDLADPIGSGQPYRFTDEDLESREMTASGTVHQVDTVCPYPVECVTGTEERQVDLGEILPVGVPILLDVTLLYGPRESAATFDGDFTGSIRAEGALVADATVERSSGIYRVHTTVYLPDEEAGVHFIVSPFIFSESAEEEWEMYAVATPLIDRIPTAFPVEFPVADAQTPPRFGPQHESLPFLLWDPDGRFLGPFNTANDVYADAIRSSGKNGEYVVYAPNTGTNLTLTTDPAAQGPDLMQVLAIETTYHDWHPAAMDETARWSFELERVPLTTGIAVRTQDLELVYHMEPEIHLETPTGKSYQNDWLFTGGMGSLGAGPPRHMVSIHAGDEDHVPGTYHATFVSNGHGYEATHFTRDYVRP